MLQNHAKSQESQTLDRFGWCLIAARSTEHHKICRWPVMEEFFPKLSFSRGRSGNLICIAFLHGFFQSLDWHSGFSLSSCVFLLMCHVDMTNIMWSIEDTSAVDTTQAGYQTGFLMLKDLSFPKIPRLSASLYGGALR